MTITDANGRRSTLVDDPSARLGGERQTGAFAALDFQISLMVQFDEPAERTIRARFGNKHADWQLIVHPAQDESGSHSEA